MGNIGFVFALGALALCMGLSARITKLERMLKKAGIGVHKSESLYNVLAKNIGKSGTLTYRYSFSLFGDKKIVCTILDVDEEWVFLEDKKKQQLLHIDSIRSVQF